MYLDRQGSLCRASSPAEEAFVTMNGRGQVVPLFAFLALALLGVSALAVDMGYYRYQQRLQQSATDAAAMAGANELVFSQSNASAAAYQAANTNGFATPAASVAINTNYADAFTTGSTGAVQVTITQNYPRFFGAIFESGSQAITTSAVASLSLNGSGCMYLLDSSPTYSFAGVTVSAPSCGLDVNCIGSSSGGSFNVGSFTYSSCTPSSAGTTYTIGGVSGASPTLSAPPVDPCPYIAGCNYLTNNPPSTTGCTSKSQAGGTLTLTPGCYSSISCAGCTTITLTPSTTTPYVITGPVSCAGCTIVGDGVTIYVTGSGEFSSAGTVYNLSPPTSGNYEGVTYYQAASDTNSSSFAGSGSTISGLFYAPSASLSVAGGGSGYAVFVADSLSVAGSTFTLTGPPAGQSLISVPSLVE
jgi:Flp pilus assembly protein TadG